MGGRNRDRRRVHRHYMPRKRSSQDADPPYEDDEFDTATSPLKTTDEIVQEEDKYGSSLRKKLDLEGKKVIEQGEEG